MDELSKCPNCAETDKVTVAGKVFCTKCGTPAADLSAANTPADTQAGSALAPPPPLADQSAGMASVQKFQTAPPAGFAPTTQVQPQSAQTPVAEQPVAQTMPVYTPPVEPQQPVAEPVAPLAPQQLQAGGLPPVAPNPLDSQINSLSQAASAPIVTPEAPVVAPAPQPEPQVVEAPVSAPPVQPTSTSNIPSLNPGQSQPQTGAMSDITIPPQPVSHVPTQTGDVMSLDKRDNAVFSDDEFKALAEQITTPPPQTPAVPTANVMPNPGSTQRPVVNTQDIKPVAPKPQPASVPTETPKATTSHSFTAEPAQVEDKKQAAVPSRLHKTKKGLKPASVALTIVGLFLAGAYIWQVNYPNLAFKIASAKAGISASMPGYVPAGWKMLGEIQTNPGNLSYVLANADESKKITVSQTKTDWDSQALAENYVGPKAQNYLSLQAQGLTIYIYGKGQGSWVNKGTWYRVEGSDQALSQEQIVKIATSL